MLAEKYVINLDRRPDRLNDFFERYGSQDVKRFSAVDGIQKMKTSDFSESEKQLLKLGGWSLNYGAGAFGCWASHIKLWEELVDSKADMFVVFEDDSFFVSDFHEKLDFILSKVTPEMDVVYFGGRSSEKFVPQKFSSEWKPYGDFFVPVKFIAGRDMDRTTQSYIVTKNGAKKLIKNLYAWTKLPLPPIDHYLNWQRTVFFTLDYFPHISYSPLNYQSDVQVFR